MAGFLEGIFEKRFHVSQEPPGWVDRWGGWDTAAGVDVSEDLALTYTAVYACVRVLAESVASLPAVLYRRRSDGGKERAVNHPLYRIVHDQTNDEMTSFEFRETMQGHLALWGNAYAQIQRNGGGGVAGMWPLRPDWVRVKRAENGRLAYEYMRPDAPVVLDEEQVLHLRGLSSNGLVGMSPIQQARQAIALGLASEEFGARFFGNGARPGIVLEHPGKLGPEAYERLKGSWTERHQGVANSHKVAILEEGLKVQTIGIPPQDAQFLETRKFQVTEIARIFRIPPHMLADLERATFSNIEHQAIEFVVHSLRPWLVKWEQRLNWKLLTKAERESYYFEFLVDGLLRGDIKSRYDAYSVGRQNGWLSANDVRDFENMNPIDGGDVYLVPLNMVEAGNPPDPSPAERHGWESEEVRAQTSSEDPVERGRRLAARRYRIMRSQEGVVADAIGRVVRREVNDVRQLARKWLLRADPVGFSLAVDEFYKEHSEFIYRVMDPVMMALGDVVGEMAWKEAAAAPAQESEEGLQKWMRAFVAAFASRHNSVSVERIKAALQRALDEGRDPYEVLEEELGTWEDGTGAEAREETNQAGNGIAREVFLLAGVSRTMWMSFSDSCPYCRNLDGKTAEITKTWLDLGDFMPEGAERPLKVTKVFRHPPAHSGCDCLTVAVVW